MADREDANLFYAMMRLMFPESTVRIVHTYFSSSRFFCYRYGHCVCHYYSTSEFALYFKDRVCIFSLVYFFENFFGGHGSEWD